MPSPIPIISLMNPQRQNTAASDPAHRKEIPHETMLQSERFGQSVFNEDRMRRYLTGLAFNSVKEASYAGTKIDRKIADQVAEGMKAWAMTMGATHYTHWFQPLT